jgi:hypothetical protein
MVSHRSGEDPCPGPEPCHWAALLQLPQPLVGTGHHLQDRGGFQGHVQVRIGTALFSGVVCVYVKTACVITPAPCSCRLCTAASKLIVPS